MKLNFRFPAEAPPNADGKEGTGKGADDKGGAGDAAAVAAAAAAAAAGTGDGGKGKQDADAAAAAAAAATAAAAAAAAKKAPEKYALTVPDGGRLDPSALTRLETIARENDWTNDEAQAYVAQVDNDLRTQSDEWAAQTKADKDLGGDKLAETQRLTQLAINKVFPENDPHRAEFVAFLNRGGAGNNINVVRFLARIGKMASEDGGVSGNSGGKEPDKPLAERMYPNQPKA